MPSKTNIPPKITASQKFLNSLSSSTRAHLEKIIGEPIAVTPAPTPASSPTTVDRNRRQSRAADRAQHSARLAAGRRPRTATPTTRKRNQIRDSQHRDARHLDRLRARLKNSGYTDAYRVKLHAVPSTVKVMMSDILSDHSAQAASIYLKRCFHQVGARLIRIAAKGPDGSRPLTSLYARRVVALGLAAIALSKRTAGHGLHSRLVKGIPQTCFLALLENPYTKERPGLSSLTGRHTAAAGAVGYLDALKTVGLLEAEQLPKSAVTPGEALGEYALNRYHVITAYPSGHVTEAELDEILRVYAYTGNAGFQQLTRSHPPFFSDSLEPQAVGPP